MSFGRGTIAMTLDKFEDADRDKIHAAEIAHCPQGHEYTVENTYLNSKGTKPCRTCRRENERAHIKWTLDIVQKKIEQEGTRRAKRNPPKNARATSL